MRPFLLATALLAVLTACGGSGTTSHSASPSTPHSSSGHSSHAVDGTTTAAPPPPAVPRFAHVVVVVEENRAYSEIIGSAAAPYINNLARSGTLLTNSYATGHPSEPNYLALFSGSTQGLTDDSCPHRYAANNVGAQVRARGQTFVGYAESLPSVGFLGCFSGAYARRHAPWTNFTDLPRNVGKPMRDFPTDYAVLPRLSFVVPNLNNDMHDGTVGQADTWLRRHLGGYVSWARTHNSLLVLTWDEDDHSANNHIASVFVGAHVRRMHYDHRVDHYRMLRTLEAACGVPAIGQARNRTPITAVWTQ